PPAGRKRSATQRNRLAARDRAGAPSLPPEAVHSRSTPASRVRGMRRGRPRPEIRSAGLSPSIRGRVARSGARRDADRLPGFRDGAALSRPEHVRRVRDRVVRELAERRRALEPLVAQRLVPDATGLFPRVTAERDGWEE